MQKKRIATVIAATAAAFTLLTTQASAITWEDDEVATATSTSTNGPWNCSSSSQVDVCFAGDGDWFYVADTYADGMSAVAFWELRNSSGTLVRGGTIWNTSGAGESRYKNKDFTEGYKLKFRACRAHWGSTSYEPNDCGAWYVQSA